MEYFSTEEYIKFATSGCLRDYKEYKSLDFTSIVPNDAGAFKYLLRFSDYCDDNRIQKTATNLTAWISSIGVTSRTVAKNILDAYNASIEDTACDNFDAKLVYENIKSYNKKASIREAISDIMDIDSLNNETMLSQKDTKTVRDKIEGVLEALDESDANTVRMPVMDTSQWRNQYEKDFTDRQNGKVYQFNDFLDKIILDGPTPGNGGIITASTGMGKSALCLNVINDVAFGPKPAPTIYLTLEMGSTQTMDRLLSIRTKIPYKDIVKPDKDVVEDIKKALDKELDYIESVKTFRISENPSLTLRQVRKHIQEFQADLVAMGLPPYCICFIDLLTMIKEFSKMVEGLNLAQAIEIAMNNLNAMAKELGIFYIGVVQLNRSVESTKVTSLESINNLKPQRAAIKNANAILERCRWCISLFRKRYYADAYLEPEVAEMVEDIIEVSVLKQNNGKVGHIDLLFDGETFSIAERDNEVEVVGDNQVE